MGVLMIKAEHVSKYYRLGKLGSGRLREDIGNWFKRRPSVSYEANQNSKQEIWALHDVSFAVKQGEVLGFVGKNGAGKSTLLKIISRIVLPTSGCVYGKGRVASLLEIGTGFHAELTGRENIYLNGNILGMNKKEITSRLDEIVQFSGVERFIDTPVKRYSSGMYMRLAFAVAAHLDPEILIVDEVLAVGDAEFQRKCLGKMKEVSTQQGKTVLFVSHNMQALKNLCNRCIALDQGKIVDEGKPENVISNYLKSQKNNFTHQSYDSPDTAPGNQYIRIKRAELIADYPEGFDVIDIRTQLNVQLEFWYCDVEAGNLIVGIHLFNFAGDCIFDICSEQQKIENGLFEVSCQIPGNFLNDGSYYISVVFVKNTTQRLFYFEACLSFEVEDYRKDTAWFGKWIGYVRPAFPVIVKPKH
ncbi:MAG TPA: ABC transporter ATP-binding protein [Flavisolibacter sp.]|nr:ABC transporter ATP-binding protein [Flavisolibacter sp.]